jgi:hypothetical protein
MLVYRNDRGTLGRGVFVLVEKSLTSVEQTQFITDVELEWVKIKLLKNKDSIILRFFFGGMSYGLLDLADLEHSDDLSEKFLVCWLEFGLLVLIGLNTERIESNVRIYLMLLH